MKTMVRSSSSTRSAGSSPDAIEQNVHSAGKVPPPLVEP
jgi:hypothetical protein